MRLPSRNEVVVDPDALARHELVHSDLMLRGQFGTEDARHASLQRLGSLRTKQPRDAVRKFGISDAELVLLVKRSDLEAPRCGLLEPFEEPRALGLAEKALP